VIPIASPPLFRAMPISLICCIYPLVFFAQWFIIVLWRTIVDKKAIASLKKLTKNGHALVDIISKYLMLIDETISDEVKAPAAMKKAEPKKVPAKIAGAKAKPAKKAAAKPAEKKAPAKKAEAKPAVKKAAAPKKEAAPKAAALPAKEAAPIVEAKKPAKRGRPAKAK